MRFYPEGDVDFFVDYTDGWDKHCRYPANKSWKRPNAHLIKSEITTINYWRDIEGAKKPRITLQDCYFPKWNVTRIRRGACLPLLYAMGERYIKLQKAPPGGFRCSPLPLSLAEVKEVKRKLKEQAKAIKAWNESQEAARNECKGKAAKKKSKCRKILSEQTKAAALKKKLAKTANKK